MNGGSGHTYGIRNRIDLNITVLGYSGPDPGLDPGPHYSMLWFGRIKTIPTCPWPCGSSHFGPSQRHTLLGVHNWANQSYLQADALEARWVGFRINGVGVWLLLWDCSTDNDQHFRGGANLVSVSGAPSHGPLAAGLGAIQLVP